MMYTRFSIDPAAFSTAIILWWMEKEKITARNLSVVTGEQIHPGSGLRTEPVPTLYYFPNQSLHAAHPHHPIRHKWV